MRPAVASLLSRGQLTRSIGVITLGHAAAYGVVLAATPVLSRLYSPAQFGVMASFSALLSLAGTSICLRYESAIPLPRGERAALRLVQLAAVVALAAAMAWGLLLAAATRTWGHYPRVAELAPFAWALAINLFAYGTFQVLTFWATRTRQFTRLAQQRLVLVVATVAVQILAAWRAPSAGGLIAGQTLGYVVAAGVMAWLMRDGLVVHSGRIARRRGIQIRTLTTAAWAYRRFPQYGVLSETLHMSQVATPPLLMAAFFGAASAGWFMLGWRVVGAPITLLVVPIARVYFAEATRIGPSRPAELRAFFVRTLLKCGLVATPVIAAIALAAPSVFPVLLGDDWAVAGRYCQLLCPVLLAHLFAISVRPTFDVTRRNDLQLLSSAIGAALMIASLGGAYALGFDATSSIGALSAAGCVAHACLVALAWRAIAGLQTAACGGDR